MSHFITEVNCGEENSDDSHDSDEENSDETIQMKKN